jgi:hypothetical protein
MAFRGHLKVGRQVNKTGQFGFGKVLLSGDAALALTYKYPVRVIALRNELSRFRHGKEHASSFCGLVVGPMP